MASITLTKSTTSVNVNPGNPINYTVDLQSNVIFSINSFSDPLPVLTGGGQWTIQNQTQVGFYVIQNVGPTQVLTVNNIGSFFAANLYEVTIVAPTNILDAGATYDNQASINVTPLGGSPFDVTTDIVTASVAVCLHSSSKVKLADSTEKEISKIESGDLILTGSGKVVPVIELVPCWAGEFDKHYGRCTFFQKDSIAPGIPSADTAIDLGHPVSVPSLYELDGVSTLKPSRQYINLHSIVLKSWADIAELLPGENRRYDLILPSDSEGTYIANGLIVKSRLSRKEPGYEYM